MASEMEDKATPRPWTIYACQFASEDPGFVCGLNDVGFDASRDECHHTLSLPDAEMIVAAVNSYDAHREIAEAAKRVLAAQIEIYEDQGWSIGTDITDLRDALLRLGEKL